MSTLDPGAGSAATKTKKLFNWSDLARILLNMESPEIAAGVWEEGFSEEYSAAFSCMMICARHFLAFEVPAIFPRSDQRRYMREIYKGLNLLVQMIGRWYLDERILG